MEEKRRSVTLVVSEDTLDKAFMPFMIAVTAASMDADVHIFFTFMGLNILRKRYKPKLSGIMKIFTGIMLRKMKKIKIPGFDELLLQAGELGVKLYACNTSMKMFDLKKEDLIDGVEVVGAAKFLQLAMNSDTQLFVG
ncbi:MAG TPA: pyridine nucleotide-disulfide oxidoreductase [Firmicutes bacterium]|nr:pyridine nucleotide-disulfide oxidoreductase [Bacillota bacterium]